MNVPVPCAPLERFPSTDRPLDGPVLTVFAGDAIVLPLTWWQVPPVYGPDGITIVTPGVPVNMTGMVPSAEFLTYGQASGQGSSLVVSGFAPIAAQFTVTASGRGQLGDLTSNLPAGPAKLSGPRIRVHYADATGNPHTFGTFYLAVR